MLIRLKQLLAEDAQLLMAVYKESNRDNVVYFFPELKDTEEGLHMTEEAYIKWICNDFLTQQNTVYYIWEEKGIWLSSLRFHEVGSKHYYMEALETHPEYRGQGYAEKLINGVIEELKGKGNFEIESYTSAKNIASQKTHKKCGFVVTDKKPFDYASQEYVDNAVGFLYRYPYSQNL